MYYNPKKVILFVCKNNSKLPVCFILFHFILFYSYHCKGGQTSTHVHTDKMAAACEILVDSSGFLFFRE